MTSVIIVEKSGKPKCVQVVSADELCKKCGFKSNAGYNLVHTWTVVFNEVEYKLDVYGKTKGKAGSENKYEFPPPIDNTLFFGNVAVIARESGKYISLDENEFNDIMEHLYGGYEDVGSDTESTDESVDLPKTKEGYVKDDFIASSDDDEEPVKPTKPSKTSKKTIKPRQKKNKEEPQIAVYVEELTEDPYFE